MKKQLLSVLVAVHKIRSLGVKNFLFWLLSKKKENDLRRELAHAYRQDVSICPERGITLFGGFNRKTSLGKVARDLALALSRAGIPYQTFDIDGSNDISFSEVRGFLTPRADFCINRYSHIIDVFDSPVPAHLLPRHSRIAFWEFDSGVACTFPKLQAVKSLIAMSDFNFTCFQKEFAPVIKVSKLLYPFRFLASPSSDEILAFRERMGLSQNDFIVFFNFDYGSSYFRKNPDGAMRAFAQAFRDTPRAKLVFKTHNRNGAPQRAEALLKLAQESGIADRFITIDAYLPERDVLLLTACCDVYLSLHRGEGFGLGIAEAMSIGKAVVVSDCSAPTEFCTPNTAMLVPCRQREIPRGIIDHSVYYVVKQCPEPDYTVAATALKKCYCDPEFRQNLGIRAQAFIADHFSTENFRCSVLDFLDG